MRAAAVLLAGLLAGAAALPGWQLIPPTGAHRTGITADPRLAEASGAAPSRKNPGIIWTIDDSGNPPDLIATDSLGEVRGVFHLADATNIDWEEVALGPCPKGTCVYIADTGDNDEARPDVVLYRVTEPAVAPDAADRPATSLDGVEALRFRYPDGPHDVEAMAVTSAGTILLVTKGRSGGVREFRLPVTAWGRPGETVAELIGVLPITPSQGTGELITGMALSPSGTEAMLRSYRTLYPFAISGTDRLTPLGRPTGCDILGLEPQGEGVGYLDERQLVLTSERGLFKAGTVWELECRVG